LINKNCVLAQFIIFGREAKPTKFCSSVAAAVAVAAAADDDIFLVTL